MTLEDEDDDFRPLQPRYDDRTAYGRICGRDREIYAKAWGIPLDYVEDGVPIGEQLFRYACHGHVDGVLRGRAARAMGRRPRRRTIRAALAAENPQRTVSKTKSSGGGRRKPRRIAALGRQPSEQDGRDGFKTRDSDPDSTRRPVIEFRYFARLSGGSLRLRRSRLSSVSALLASKTSRASWSCSIRRALSRICSSVSSGRRRGRQSRRPARVV